MANVRVGTGRTAPRLDVIQLPGSTVTDRWLGVNVLDPKFGVKGDYVTDETDHMQGAANFAGAQAAITGYAGLWLPSGYGYKFGQLSIPSGVFFVAEGAIISPILSEVNQALLYYSGGGSLNRFGIYGGTWLGTGTEGSGANNQLLFQVAANQGCNDVLFKDMFISNWGSGPLYIRNPQRAKALNVTMLNVGQASAANYNAINFVVSGDGTLEQGQDLVAMGCTVMGAKAAAIAYVNNDGTGPSNLQLRFIGNTTGGIAGGTHISGGIYCELDAGGTFTGAKIAKNSVNNPATTSPAQGIWTSFGVAATIDDNDIVSSNIGIQVDNQHDGALTNNRINAPTPFSGAGNIYRSGNRISTGPSQGQVALTAGSVTVPTTEVQAGDNIVLSRVAAGGTHGELTVGTIIAGTSFAINSNSSTDTSTIYWRIDH